MIKKHKALLAYMLALAVFTTYVVMDTFVISYTLTGVDEGSDQEMLHSVNASDYAFAESSLDDGEDENISVQIDSYRYEDTTIYVADVTVSSAKYLPNRTD